MTLTDALPTPARDDLVPFVTPDEAHTILAAYLGGSGTGTPLEAAWRALDGALRADGDLPQAWERLTSGAASERAGRPKEQWANLVTTGYAPAPDGHDGAGRAWWHPATVDAWRNGTWKPIPRQERRPEGSPPGGNDTREAWAEWATSQGVGGIRANMRRGEIINLCRFRGVL